MLGRACLFRFGPVAWACLAPFLWTGLEFFRSELYYLRFSWLNAGYVFSDSAALHYLSAYGVYGIGFLFMAAVGAAHLRGRARWTGVALLTAAALYPALIPAPRAGAQKTLRVAGVQLEFPGSATVLAALNDALGKIPRRRRVWFSANTPFTGPVPDTVKAWCRQTREISGGWRRRSGAAAGLLRHGVCGGHQRGHCVSPGANVFRCSS